MLPEKRHHNRQGLVILGMHRSGTSALAGTLGKLGASMPVDLMGAGIGNDKGHWEPAGIVAVNDRILESAGSHWEDWDCLNPDWYESLVYPLALKEARAALRLSFTDAPLFIMKDPRVCRLVPFWTNVFELESIDPVFLLCLRHPAQVAASLFKRDAMEPGYAGLLWLRHTLEGEAATRGRRRTICDFDQLLGNWQVLVTRLGLDLGIIWPRRSAQMRHEVDQFLSASSKTHLPTAMPGVMPWAIETYVILRRWAEQGEDKADYAKLDAIFRRFNDASSMFSDLILPGSRSLGAGGGHALREELENVRAALAAATEERENSVKHLQNQLRDALEAGEKVSNTLSDRDANVMALHSEMEELRQREGDRIQIQAERDSVLARIRELEAELHTAEHASADMVTILSNRDADIAALRSEMEELRQRESVRMQIQAERDGVLARIIELEAELHAAKHASADMVTVLSDRDAHILALHSEIEELRQREGVHVRVQAEHDGVLARIGELEAELHAMTRTSANIGAALVARDEQVAGLQAELGKVQSGFTDIQLRNEQNVEAARQSAHQIAMLENRLRQREEEVEQACRERDEAREAYAQLEAVQEKLKNARKDIFEIAADRREYQVAAERAERAVHNLGRLLHDEKAARASSDLALSAVRGRMTDFVADLDQAHQEIEARNEQNEELLHAAQRAQAHVATLEAQLNSAQGQLFREEKKRQELKSALSNAEADVGKLYEEMATVNQQFMATETRYAALRHKHHCQDEHVQNLLQKLSAAEERFAIQDSHAEWLLQVTNLLVDSPRWWSFIPSTWRRRRQLERLKESGLFDGKAYLDLHHDVAAAGADPLRHYLDYGMTEGRLLPR